MGTTTIKNVRATSDLTVRVRLKDGGVAVEWSELSNIKAWLYSDAQKAISGRFEASVDQEDPTTLICVYSAQKPQYLGINRVIVQASYLGELKTYDKKAFSFVRWTEEQGTITIDDPDVDVEIEVEDVTSSILQEAIAAALQAAADAEAAAHLVPLQVLQDCVEATQAAGAATSAANDAAAAAEAAAGRAPYIDETTGHWFVWDATAGEYVDSGEDAQGPQGDPGPTPQITVGQTETGSPGSDADVSISGTAAAPILNFTIPRGEPGVAAVKYIQVAELPIASSHTMDALYLVPTQTEDVFDVYYTSRDGQSTYSWVKLCTTSAQLSDYATKAEVDQLEAIVHNMSGKFYEPVASSSELPEGDEVGYTFVGATAPFAVWYFNGTSWSDTGIVVTAITGEPGVGFRTIATPTVADGTVIITLSDGNTITLDLNHDHAGYCSKVLGGAQPVGGFLPDVVYSLGTLTGTITFSLAAAVTGNVNHYFWMFDTSSTAPTVTWPAGITWAAGAAPTVAASKHYEISILGGIAYYSEV